MKQLLYIPPDERPYTLWMTRHVFRFDRAVEIYVYNDTKSPHKIYGDAVVLTSGVYEVYYGGQLVARLRLMSRTSNTTVFRLPTNATAGTAFTTTVATTATVTTTATQTRTTTLILPKTVTTTATKTATVEKPHVHSITYVAIAVAVVMMILAVYLAKRSRLVA